MASRSAHSVLRSALALLPILTLTACAMTKKPPLAPIEPKALERHGMTRVDNYYWLRDREDPRTLKYLKAENAYTRSVLKPMKAASDALYGEFVARLKEDDVSAPVRYGGYFYYERVAKGQEHEVHCRRKAEEGAPEEVILDVNALAEGKEYLKVGVFHVSPDSRYLAYSTDEDGSEEYRLHFRDLATGKDLPETIMNTYYGGAWSADGRTYFYPTLGEANRPDKVWRHTLGTDAKEDVLVYEEKDDRYFLTPSDTLSGKYIFLSSEANNASEIRFIPADEPAAEPKLLRARRDGVEYDAVHHGDHFYIRTNDQALNFRVVRVPADKPGATPEEVIPHRADTLIEDFEAFQDFFAITLRRNAQVQVAFRDAAAGTSHEVVWPEPVFECSLGENLEFAPQKVRLDYTSLVTPASEYDYNPSARELTLVKREEVPTYDASLYETVRVEAPARDGARIPVTLFYRKGLERNGANPGYLYSYGSYGISSDVSFVSSWVSLADRGFVVAVAHIRGGSERGRAWYDSGKMFQKMNTFTDFIDSAEFLVEQGYTKPEALAIEGGSAGGLLMGAVTNMRPDLFRVVIADVPFVDVVTTMLDPTIPLTTNEYTEWGNPENRDSYDYMLAYSPYDNVQAREYPHMFVDAGLNDPRVAYWEPAKWVAKMRRLRTDSNMLVLRTNMGAGHGGASGRYASYRESADRYAFILHALGVAEGRVTP